MSAQIIKFPTPKSDLLTPALDGEVVDLGHAPAKRSRRKAKRPVKRVEQLAVTCSRAPRKHSDLLRQVGVLTIDFVGGQPYTVTFDPSDESIENIVAPVEGWNRGDEAIAVKSDEGTWVFAPLGDEDVTEP